jgi:hypothetical protein
MHTFLHVCVYKYLYYNVVYLLQEKYLSADKTIQNAKPADVVYER